MEEKQSELISFNNFVGMYTAFEEVYNDYANSSWVNTEIEANLQKMINILLSKLEKEMLETTDYNQYKSNLEAYKNAICQAQKNYDKASQCLRRL